MGGTLLPAFKGVGVSLDTSLTVSDSDYLLSQTLGRICHAILTYLADTYGKNDSMYPRDLKQRTLVNQKLFFDTAVLYQRVRNITTPAIFYGVRKPPHFKDIEEAYGILEEFLTRSKYLAGNNITIADVAAIANVTSLGLLDPLDGQRYPKLFLWTKELESQPFCKKCNAPGTADLDAWMEKSLDY